ncbi:integrase catalytic domain-containing protein [Trichonephila clavipes]|nr:integrase catalytic domain-containing protein [Trichonephila clavipes]
MFQTLDRETAAHINIRQSGDWFRPLQLGKECDLYFTSSVGGSVEDEPNLYSCGLICGSEELNSNLRKFWEIEEIDNELPKNLEKFYLELEGYCSKRLESLWTRLSRDQDYQKLYRDFLKEYEELGHMTEITESVEPEYTYYMPHHGIYRPQKSTTKLRTVFNASALTANGRSLNSIQYNGGVIQDDLFSLLVRFRKHIYAFTADIRQMYRMIDVDVSQRPLQRILWKGDVNEPVKVYQLNTVTYGTASAPFLAMRTLKQISIDEGENFPLAASVLCDDFYMDDVLSGANSLEVAKTLQHQLIDILQTAQMSLHKWCGNTSELIPTTEKEYDFASPEEIKTLGIAWKSKTDCFNFKVEVERNAHPTKRSVLSIIARLFDPLGLLGPVITKAKIFMQQLWTLQIDWSERLPEKEASEWKEFVRSLVALNGINIERCIVIPNAEVIELHGFCDASERAYGAAIYTRSINPDGEIKVKLVASKSRVSPVKQVTMPRLELCSAVLLAKLMHKVKRALRMDITSVFFWTDSTIVLSWMKNESRNLKTFVANRVVIIQELTELNKWHHVPSEQNPADIISRGLDPEKIQRSELWWFGPAFLESVFSELPSIRR